MVEAYWNVGREIVEKQGGRDRATYGNNLIKSLSVKLTAEFDEGFTATNLRYMRLVYLAFPNHHTLCDKLSWSHYRILASVEKVFAVKYHLHLPTVEELQLELRRERAAIEEALLLNGPEETKAVSARSSGRKRGAK